MHYVWFATKIFFTEFVFCIRAGSISKRKFATVPLYNSTYPFVCNIVHTLVVVKCRSCYDQGEWKPAMHRNASRGCWDSTVIHMVLCRLSYNHIIYVTKRTTYKSYPGACLLRTRREHRTRKFHSGRQYGWGDIGTSNITSILYHSTAVYIQLWSFKQRRAAAGTTRQENLTQSVQFMLLNGRPKFILNDLSGHGRVLVYNSSKPICGHI